VGTFAVQIAAELGAEVTGVCGPDNVELVRSLGASRVIDYTREDFTDGRVWYDLILDNVGNRPPRRLCRALTPAGTLVGNAGGSPGRVFGAVGSTLVLVASRAVAQQRLRVLMPATPAGPTHRDLLTVTALIDSGRLTPVVDRVHPLAWPPSTWRTARGKTVLTVA
jgi:NADPH:quinone reductase-like Zn-dependent oxidoreductase